MTSPAFHLWPTKRRVERTAWNTIVRCTRELNLAKLPLPVPVEKWIEHPLGIKLHFCDLPPGSLGSSHAKLNEIFINAASCKPETRLSFTLAHELGHVLLHHKVRDDFRQLADGIHIEERLEREANRFASAFLMPVPAFEFEFEQSATVLGMEPGSLLAAIVQQDSSACTAFSTVVLPRLMAKFGVSFECAVRRFSDLQLANTELALPWNTVTWLLGSSPAAEIPRLF